MSRVIRKLDQYINYGFITLILCLVAFLLCAHLMACAFYFIASRYDNFHEVGWVATLAKQTNQPFSTNPNLTNPVLPTLPSLYVSSLYYCLTSLTTIGFGNISPNTTAEKIFGSIFMIVGGMFCFISLCCVLSIRPFDNYVTHTFWSWSLALISKLRKVIGSRFMRARLPGQMTSLSKGCTLNLSP